MRVGLFVTCLVDLMRPSIGFAAHPAARSGRRRGLRAAHADLLRPAGVQLGRPRGRQGARGEGRRRVRGLRLPGRAVRFVQRHDPHALRRSVRRRSRRWRSGSRRSPRRRASSRTSSSTNLKLEHVPGRFDGTVTYHDSCAGLREMGVKTQPRALLAKVPRPHARRDGRVRDLLRLRRHVLDQVRRDLGAARRQQVRAHRGERRRRGRAGRSRLHAEHRGPAAPARRRRRPRCCTSPRCWRGPAMTDATRQRPVSSGCGAATELTTGRPCKSHRCTSRSARTSS